jgi:hypothetical protein
MAPTAAETGFPGNPGTKPANLERRCQLGERFGRGEALTGHGQSGKLLVQVGIDLCNLIAQRAQMLDNSGILAKKRREDLVADSNALEGTLMIGRIVDEWKPTLDGVVADLGTLAIQERPDDSIGSPGLDPTQPTKARTPEHTCQDGLRLVILRMSHGDGRCTARGRDLSESLVSKLARPRLNRSALPSHIDPRRVEWNSQLLCKGSDAFDLRGRFRTKRMID